MFSQRNRWLVLAIVGSLVLAGLAIVLVVQSANRQQIGHTTVAVVQAPSSPADFATAQLTEQALAAENGRPLTATNTVAAATPAPTEPVDTPTVEIAATATAAVSVTPTVLRPDRATASAEAPPTATVQPVAAYVFPVGATKYSYGRTHHDYPATDIFCPVGSTFLAPTGGIIDFVSREDNWNSQTDNPEDRGGLSIALIGDDGWRYYGSHLSVIAEGIEPGKRVTAGQSLGLTGASGNASVTPPHLHFGISHPTTPDDWQVRRGEISPYPFLKAWEKGEDMAPRISSAWITPCIEHVDCRLVAGAQRVAVNKWSVRGSSRPE